MTPLRFWSPFIKPATETDWQFSPGSEADISLLTRVPAKEKVLTEVLGAEWSLCQTQTGSAAWVQRQRCGKVKQELGSVCGDRAPTLCWGRCSGQTDAPIAFTV